jgi:hypothetical protein
MSGTALAQYDAMRLQVAQCARVDEAAEIRNRADKLRAYAKQKKDHELHRWMGEIFCRATLRYGELSKGMDKAKVVGGRGGKAELRLPAGGKSKEQQIKASGLSKSAAHRAEALAGARRCATASCRGRWTRQSLPVATALVFPAVGRPRKSKSSPSSGRYTCPTAPSRLYRL